MNKIHCMLDLETLGTEQDAAIVQLGAVVFDAETIYERFTANICLDDTRTFNADTIKWWLQQDKNVIESVFDRSCIPLGVALIKFASFYGVWGCGTLWGNGSMFDNAIIKNAYEQLNTPAPFTYKHHRCFRTMKEVFRNQVPEPLRDSTKAHIAVEDALHQTLWLQEIHRKIGGIL